MDPTNANIYTTLEQQGQNQYGTDVSQASNYGQQYNAANSQASSANANLQNYVQQNQGAYNPNTGTGNAGSAYNYELGQLQNQYDPNLGPQLTNANNSLFQLTGALNGANQSFSTPGGVGSYGLSAPALAGYENSITAPLQTGVSNANTQVNTLNSQLANLLTGANQFTTNAVQGQQNEMTGLNQVTQNILAQVANAMSQQQFYQGQAQNQFAENESVPGDYAAYQNQLASAAQAAAQANLTNIQASNTPELDASQIAANNKVANPTPAPTPAPSQFSAATLNSDLGTWGQILSQAMHPSQVLSSIF